ncbi:MAG: hypothetical protein [Olavius algarvensis Gamma 1 endosymbiont]|nr:MAG: hypothetical protein [Olavius algarvensis Gamma 1 endosymbiont]
MQSHCLSRHCRRRLLSPFSSAWLFEIYSSPVVESICTRIEWNQCQSNGQEYIRVGYDVQVTIRVVPLDNFMIYKDIIRLDRPD